MIPLYRVKTRSKDVDDLAEERDGRVLEKASERDAGGVGAHAPFRGAPFRALDGFVQAPAHAGDFH
jgi:hypothetical protein